MESGVFDRFRLEADIEFGLKHGNPSLRYLALSRRRRYYWEKAQRDQKICTGINRLRNSYLCFRFLRLP